MNNDKQLTPEEIEINRLAELYAHSVWGDIEACEGRGTLDEFAQSQEDFIAGYNECYQQTAAKDEEITKLKEEARAWKEKALDKEWHRIRQKDEEITKLEKERDDLKVRIDNRQDSDIALSIMKKAEAKDARIAELEEELNDLQSRLTSKEHVISGIEETCGQYKKERDRAFDLLGKWKNWYNGVTDYSMDDILFWRDTLLSSLENKKP